MFISHAEGDGTVANALEAFLKLTFSSQVRVFNISNDQSLEPGDDWWATIEKNLQDLQVMLVVVTPQNVNRPWIHFEAGAAWLLQKRVIPCLARGMTKSSLPSPLNHFQAVSLSVERDVQRLINAIARECTVDSRSLKKRDFRSFQKSWSAIPATRRRVR